jgi:hypothetical protein
MTATAVAGDRVADPALCSTPNSSTQARAPRPAPGAAGPDSWHAGMIRPMARSLLPIGLLATMVGAWYWALSPGAPTAPAAGAATRASRAGSATAPLVRLEHLATHEAARPVPEQGRNPFGAIAAGPTADRGREESPPPIPALPSALPAVDTAEPAWPQLALIGVAEGREADGVVRTAILSGPHGVQHARAGQIIEQVYRLERIAADGVDVRLLPEDRLLRLALRP